jgi:hypothetical protein
MPNDCIEGHRKKAKYLLDDEELGQCSLSHISLSGDLIACAHPAQKLFSGKRVPGKERARTTPLRRNRHLSWKANNPG